MNKNELWYLAGWLEGEGSFLKAPPSNPGQPAIAAVTTDEDTAKRISELLDVTYCPATRKNMKPHWKTVYRLVLRGRRAAELMLDLRPLMSTRRQSQIDAALATRIKDSDLQRKILTPREQELVRELVKSGLYTKTSVAKRFGTNRNTIARIAPD